jgi:hypothetical protein|tara:strand:+ start:825 stop:1079 length:255 start_codon:yes stop_codon:yes gene_type:complete
MRTSKINISQVGTLYDQGMEAEDVYDMFCEQFSIVEIRAAIHNYIAATDAAENDEDDPDFDPFRGTSGPDEEVEYLDLCAQFNL